MFGQRVFLADRVERELVDQPGRPKYELSFDGERTFIHSGRRGRSATGCDVSIGAV
jgi:hypothetical protein